MPLLGNKEAKKYYISICKPHFVKTTLVIAAVLWSIALSGQSCNIDGISYFDFGDIVQILDKNNCNSCHSPSGEAANWQYNSYDDMLAEDECGNQILVHGNASESALYDKLNRGTAACGSPMPIDRPPLSQQELYAVESWINSGATQSCIPLYSEIKEVLSQENCGSCHTASSTWSLRSYDHMLGLQNNTHCDDLVTPYSASTSTLYTLMTEVGNVCEDVPVHDRIPELAVDLLRDWINAGALEGSASLPVELADFDLKLLDPTADVLLNWISTSEIGTDRYIVERSNDGRSFTQISEVQAVGSSTNTEMYSYTDTDTFLGLAYYRLRIMDFDGSFSYSHIISVRKEPTTDVLTLTPSLLMGSSTLNISWYSRIERPEANAYIVNASGQSIEKVKIVEGENPVPLPGLDNGLYYIVIHNFFDSYQLGRFIVVNQ